MIKIVYIALLCVALSISYYFVLYLPQRQQAELSLEQKQQAQQLRNEIYTKQKECSELAQKAFAQAKSGYPTEGYPQLELLSYHYNTKLNTCLYATQELNSEINSVSGCAGFDTSINDLFTGNTVLQIIQNAPTCKTTINRDYFNRQYEQLLSE